VIDKSHIVEATTPLLLKKGKKESRGGIRKRDQLVGGRIDWSDVFGHNQLDRGEKGLQGMSERDGHPVSQTATSDSWAIGS
jgi:hypothetical protein